MCSRPTWPLVRASSCVAEGGLELKWVRLANDVTQTQDVFSDLAQYSTVPASSSATPRILAAIFAGLLAAGIVLLGITAVRRQRARTSPASGS